MAAMHKSMHGMKPTEELYSCFPEPDPDYDAADDGTGDFPPPPPPLTAEQLSEAVAQAYEHHTANGDVAAADDTALGMEGAEPLIIRPKPLANPCVESKERQMLHKELLMNYKIGKDVLQKPELNKVLRERRETQRKKEWEEHKPHDRNSLEYKLQERANKMKEEEEKSNMNSIQEDAQTPEFMRMHRRITHKGNKASES